MSRNNIIVIPYGWRRHVNTSCSPSASAVTYVSPSGVVLSSTVEVCQYLEKDNTCKCGLPCPIHVPKVFSFNPEVRSVNLPKREWSRRENITESHRKNCQHWNKLQKAQLGKKNVSSHPELSMEPAPKLLIIRKDGKLRSVIPNRSKTKPSVKKAAGSTEKIVKLPTSGPVPTRKSSAVSPLKSPLFEPGPSAIADSAKQPTKSKNDFKLQWIKADDDATQNDAESENDELCFSPDFKKSPPLSFPQPLISGMASPSAIFKQEGQFGLTGSQPRAAKFRQSSTSELPSRHSGIEPVHRFGMSSFPGSNFVMKGNLPSGGNNPQNMYLQDTQRFPVMSVKSEQASQLNPMSFGVAPNAGSNRRLGFPGAQDPSGMVWQQNQGNLIGGNQKQLQGKGMMKSYGNYLPRGQRPSLKSPTGQAQQRFPMGSPTMLNPTSPYGFQTVNMGQSVVPLASPGGSNPSPFSNRSQSRSSSVGTPAPSPGGPRQSARPVHVADSSRPLSRSSNATTPGPEASPANLSQWSISSSNVGTFTPHTLSAVGGFPSNISPAPNSPYLPQRYPQSSSMVRFPQDANKGPQTDMSTFTHSQNRTASERLRFHSQSYQQQNPRFENPGGIQYQPSPFNPAANSQYPVNMNIQGSQQQFSPGFENNVFRPCPPYRPAKVQFARINEPDSTSLPRFPFKPIQQQMPAMQHQGTMLNQRFMANPQQQQWRPFSSNMAAMRPGQYYPSGALPPGMSRLAAPMVPAPTSKPKRTRKKKASKSSTTKAQQQQQQQQQQPLQQTAMNAGSSVAATEFPDFFFPAQKPNAVHAPPGHPTISSSQISSDLSAHQPVILAQQASASQSRLPAPSLVMPTTVTTSQSITSSAINVTEKKSSSPCETTVVSTLAGQVLPLLQLPSSLSSVDKDSGSGVTTPPPLPVLSPTLLFDEPAVEDDFSDFVSTNPGVFEFPVDTCVTLQSQLLPALPATTTTTQTLCNKQSIVASSAGTLAVASSGTMPLTSSIASTVVMQSLTIASSLVTEIAQQRKTSVTRQTQALAGLYAAKYPLPQRQGHRPNVTSLVSSTGKVFHVPSRSRESIARRFSDNPIKQSRDTRKRYMSDPYPVAVTKDSTAEISRRLSSIDCNRFEVEQAFGKCLPTLPKVSTSRALLQTSVCTASRHNQAQVSSKPGTITRSTCQPTSSESDKNFLAKGGKKQSCMTTDCNLTLAPSISQNMSAATVGDDKKLSVSVCKESPFAAKLTGKTHCLDVPGKDENTQSASEEGKDPARTQDLKQPANGESSTDRDKVGVGDEIGEKLDAANVPEETQQSEDPASTKELRLQTEAVNVESALPTPVCEKENMPGSKAEDTMIAEEECMDISSSPIEVRSPSGGKLCPESESVAPTASEEERNCEKNASCKTPAETSVSQTCTVETSDETRQDSAVIEASNESSDGVPVEGESVDDASGEGPIRKSVDPCASANATFVESSCRDVTISSNIDATAISGSTDFTKVVASGDAEAHTIKIDTTVTSHETYDIESDDATSGSNEVNQRVDQNAPKNGLFLEAATPNSDADQCPMPDEEPTKIKEKENVETPAGPLLLCQHVTTAVVESGTVEVPDTSSNLVNTDDSDNVLDSANTELVESSPRTFSPTNEIETSRSELRENRISLKDTCVDINCVAVNEDEEDRPILCIESDSQQLTAETSEVEDSPDTVTATPLLDKMPLNVKAVEEAGSDNNTLSSTEEKSVVGVASPVAQEDDIPIENAPARQQETKTNDAGCLTGCDETIFNESATEREAFLPFENGEDQKEDKRIEVKTQNNSTCDAVPCRLNAVTETVEQQPAESHNKEKDEGHCVVFQDSLNFSDPDKEAIVRDTESSSTDDTNVDNSLLPADTLTPCVAHDDAESENMPLSSSTSCVIDEEKQENSVPNKASPTVSCIGEEARQDTPETDNVASECETSPPKELTQRGQAAVLEGASVEKEAETDLSQQDSQVKTDATEQKFSQPAAIPGITTAGGTLNISPELTTTVIRQLSNYNTILKNLLTRQVTPGELAQLTSAATSAATNGQQSDVISALIANAAPMNRLFNNNTGPSGLTAPITSIQKTAAEPIEQSSGHGVVTQAEISTSDTLRDLDRPVTSSRQTPEPRFAAEKASKEAGVVSASHTADSSQTMVDKEKIQPLAKTDSTSGAHQGLQVPIVSSSVKGTNSGDREEEENEGANLRSNAPVAENDERAVQSEVSTSVKQNDASSVGAPPPINAEVKAVSEKRRGRPRNAVNRQSLKRHATGEAGPDKVPKRPSTATSFPSNARAGQRGSGAGERQTRIVKSGDLIWGQMRGFPSWPGRVVKPSEVRGLQQRAPLSEGKVWVKWFGDHTFTQMNPTDLVTMTEGLEAHHRSRKKGRTRTRKISIHLEKAIQEAVDQLEQQQGSLKKISMLPGTSSIAQPAVAPELVEKPRRGRKRKTT